MNHLVVSEHVQPVLDNIETVEEDKHGHHEARLRTKDIENGRNWCGSLFVKGRLYKLTLRPRRLVQALLSQSTWV